ncbi:hypothetical protein GOBAR_AA27237 [Gossypium barbadense]|uniref:Ternary complex factor MIP1 leucine-zipper domain-containing protein n=1 Tax=Gossypium barbadense TaxID=3634 RepID=A0A2P5WQS0_GOSBA|nr:hypothetical protein GOBAR_AA27237 [Gossypium barbadense]
MNSRGRNSLQSTKVPGKHEKEEAEMQGIKPTIATKTMKNRRASSKERKKALQQDVDKLKKKLRQEENIHRALERAFNRPLGALPRLPPYLPPPTLELLAEVAVLEEEIVRLEEQVVHFRQDLYQEAVYTSTSKRNMESSADSSEPCLDNSPKRPQPRTSTRNTSMASHLQTLSGKTLELLAEVAVLEEEIVRLEEQVVHFRQDLYQEAVYTSTSKRNMESSADSSEPCLDNSPKRPQPRTSTRNTSMASHLQSLSDEGRGKENQSCTNSTKSNKGSLVDKSPTVKTPFECRVRDLDSAEARNLSTSEERPLANDGPNKVSEELVKCLSTIFLRMSSKKRNSAADSFPSLSMLGSQENSDVTKFQDPYGICSNFGRRDIGPYKHLFPIDAGSINLNRTSNSLFLLRRLKLLLGRLATTNLQNLNHQEKLAFWINIYNSCMMNAFLEHGVPESPEMVVELMRKATINVGRRLLNAITIEHFILRLPYHSKFTFSKGAKNDEMTARSMFGLELSEPLVTFALSCGSWSSPALSSYQHQIILVIDSSNEITVRVYTASHVDAELEVAKKEYLQATVGISSTKFAIPKLLDWYLLDFAKDLDSLLDWICLQLPSEIGKEAIKYLERAKSESLLQFVQIIPYDFSFRYLLCT